MRYFTTAIAEYVWNTKYRYFQDGKTIDQNLVDTWTRVAKAAAKAEAKDCRKQWEQRFFEILEHFRFLPGGRILAGCGTKRKVTLANCFVMGEIEDSLTGIFNNLKEGALTLQQGGGIGSDFSTLRPSGEMTDRSGSIASGPVSFMHIWDAMSATMQSTGTRRGAMMGVLRCDHPDIEDFITAKKNPQHLRHFNVSVLVTDAFMRAVHANKEWALVFPMQRLHAQYPFEIINRRWSGNCEEIPCRVFRYVKARELWNKIIKAAYEYAEPGILFEDTINRMNNLYYCEYISATNPCGEVPLPHYGACNLGSINLTQFVEEPFTPQAKLNWHGLIKVCELGTRFLDNIIDVSRYPLPAQKYEAEATRRIGLGITGLADCFTMLGIMYGSQKSINLVHKIMKVICETSWQASIELARERGNFPEFSKQDYLKGRFVQNLADDIKTAITKYGMRNSHHNVIAPTGTISLFANNISSGLEPIFEAEYERRIRAGNGDVKLFIASAYALQVWQRTHPQTRLPPAWIDAQELTPTAHLKIQLAAQPYIDGAISKTIFIPEHFPFKDVAKIYAKAYSMKLKGCTIFRPNPTTGSILSTRSLDNKGARCCLNE